MNLAQMVKNFKFLKDIISFSNTIRLEPSYIIFGVKELGNGEKNINGLSKSLDDATLQNIVKDKLFPMPKFLYHEKQFEGKTIGILEFPLIRYDYPITSKFELKGVEKDKVYYRTGSRNSEADIPTVAKIYDWMKTLPSETETNSFLSEALTLFDDSTKLLSEILPVLLAKSKKYGYAKLSELIQAQLKDIKEIKNHPYRYQELYVATGKSVFEYGAGVNDSTFKRELENSDGVVKTPFPINDSIYKIEQVLKDFETNKTIYMSRYWENFHKDYEDYTVTLFYFKDTYENLIINIKQRLIDEIVSIK